MIEVYFKNDNVIKRTYKADSMRDDDGFIYLINGTKRIAIIPLENLLYLEIYEDNE